MYYYNSVSYEQVRTNIGEPQPQTLVIADQPNSYYLLFITSINLKVIEFKKKKNVLYSVGKKIDSAFYDVDSII